MTLLLSLLCGYTLLYSLFRAGVSSRATGFLVVPTPERKREGGRGREKVGGREGGRKAGREEGKGGRGRRRERAMHYQPAMQKFLNKKTHKDSTLTSCQTSSWTGHWSHYPLIQLWAVFFSAQALSSLQILHPLNSHCCQSSGTQRKR